MLTRDGLDVSKSMLVIIMARLGSSASGLKPDVRAVSFMFVLSDKDFRKGIIADHWQFPAETLGEASGLGVVESRKDAMGEQAPGAEKCLINVGSRAVDGTDDLKVEEIAKQAVGEVENGADLILIVVSARH